MSFFSRIFKEGALLVKAPEQAVIIYVPLSGGANGTTEEFDHLVAFEEKLEEAIIESGAGEFDGNEFGQSVFTYFMYGADADRLFSVVVPLLQSDDFIKKGRAVLRYGGPGAKQREVPLTE